MVFQLLQSNRLTLLIKLTLHPYIKNLHFSFIFIFPVVNLLYTDSFRDKFIALGEQTFFWLTGNLKISI